MAFILLGGGIVISSLTQGYINDLQLSVMIAAFATSIELAVSGTIPLGVVLAAMAGWHALIGIGEGIITAVVIAFVSKSEPGAQRAKISLR